MSDSADSLILGFDKSAFVTALILKLYAHYMPNALHVHHPDICHTEHSMTLIRGGGVV